MYFHILVQEFSELLSNETALGQIKEVCESLQHVTDSFKRIYN